MNSARDVPNPTFKAEPSSNPGAPIRFVLWSLRLLCPGGQQSDTLAPGDGVTPRSPSPPLCEDAGNFSARFPEKNLTQTQRFGINLLSSPSSGTNQILHSRAVSGPEVPQRVDEPGWNFLVNKGQRWAA